MQSFAKKRSYLLNTQKENGKVTCSKVGNMEKEYWQQAGLMDKAIDSMNIYLGESSDYLSTD